MRDLLCLIHSHNDFKKEEPLPIKDVIEAQKELVKFGLVFLPSEFIELLKVYNGIKGEDGSILGINPKDKMLDIVNFNKIHNASNEKVILGYDDFAYLVYDNSQKKYLLIDRSDGLELDDFLTEEFVSAVSSVLHF